MQFTSTFLSTVSILAATLLPGVNAAPSAMAKPVFTPDGLIPVGDVSTPLGARSEENLGKRTNGGVYVCKGYGWTGECALWVLGYDQCNNVSSGWATSISAVGPDPGTYCIIYTSTNCGSGGSLIISNPGGDLNGGTNNYWNQYNDNVKSLKCWW